MDRLHRPGNVHDSNGALDFARYCFQTVRKRLPQAVLEARIDSAFFQEDYLTELDKQGVEFTASVPFARFTKLKKPDRSSTALAADGSDVVLFRDRLEAGLLESTVPHDRASSTEKDAYERPASTGLV